MTGVGLVSDIFVRTVYEYFARNLVRIFLDIHARDQASDKIAQRVTNLFEVTRSVESFCMRFS